MEFVVYILYSKKFDKTYVGFTNSIIQRFYSHNFHATKGYTIKYRPWEVVYVEFFDNKSEAIKRETWLKSGIGREYIVRLKETGYISAAAD
jgi:putative endonuclease